MKLEARPLFLLARIDALEALLREWLELATGPDHPITDIKELRRKTREMLK